MSGSKHHFIERFAVYWVVWRASDIVCPTPSKNVASHPITEVAFEVSRLLWRISSDSVRISGSKN